MEETTLREKVQKILGQSYSSYSYEDIDDLSKLKLQIGSKVAQAKRKKLSSSQNTKREKSRLYMTLRADGKSIEDAKQQVIVETNELELADIILDTDYEELKNYYEDLQDCLISVRQNVKAFDYEQNKGVTQ